MIPHLIIALVIALGSFGAAWKTQEWRYESNIAEINQRHADESDKARTEALEKERSFNDQLRKAQDEATQREANLRAAADTSRRSADGLRLTLEKLRASNATATPATVIARADTTADLLGACVSEYRAVAEAADRIASDRQTLIDAWPR